MVLPRCFYQLIHSNDITAFGPGLVKINPVVPSNTPTITRATARKVQDFLQGRLGTLGYSNLSKAYLHDIVRSALCFSEYILDGDHYSSHVHK